MMRAFTLADIETALQIPLSIAGPWAAYIQKLVWLYGEYGALARLYELRAAA